MSVIYFASNNGHKRDELAAILSAMRDGAHDSAPNIEIKLPKDMNINFDVDENGADFAQNALIKAKALHKILREKNINAPVIADDSGLCVDVLNGRPGIYSARYCGAGCGADGAANGKKLKDAERNALLLAEIKTASSALRHSITARFVCAMTLLHGENRFFIAQETLEGEIALSPRGESGFGYDPLLFLPELGRTVAELSPAEKCAISHRAKAARCLFLGRKF